MSRATARIAAMQLIFERLAGGQGGDDSLRMVYDELQAEGRLGGGGDTPSVADRAWIETVLAGVLSRQEELDRRIGEVSRGWTVERMPRVDLTILRLATWELLYEQDVPGPAVINEAVELARCYSEPDSSRFINGVLGTILRAHEDAQAKEADGAAAPAADGGETE